MLLYSNSFSAAKQFQLLVLLLVQYTALFQKKICCMWCWTKGKIQQTHPHLKLCHMATFLTGVTKMKKKQIFNIQSLRNVVVFSRIHHRFSFRMIRYGYVISENSPLLRRNFRHRVIKCAQQVSKVQLLPTKTLQITSEPFDKATRKQVV